MLIGIPIISTSRYGFDPDAEAFFSAAGIGNPYHRININVLVTRAKANGWWTLCNAIYPMVGGTATTHKFNLKNPQDTDAAFRLNFQGTWVHSATGADPNGSTAYADTFLIPSSVLTLNSTHVSYYSRTNSAISRFDIAVLASGNLRIGLVIRDSTDTELGDSYYPFLDPGRIVVSNTDSRGHFICSRISSTDLSLINNGSVVATRTATETAGLPTVYSLYIGAQNNNGTADSFTDRECAFATIGAGISSTIASLMYTDIQNFQISMGRAV